LDSILSLILLVVLIIDMISGYKKGFIRVAIDIIGTLLALFLSFRYYGLAGEFVSRFISGMSLIIRNIVGFIIVFALVGIAIEVLGHVLSIIMKLPGLSLLNRLAGAVISLVKTYLILSVITFLIFSLGITAVNQTIKDSNIAVKMTNSGQVMYGKIQQLIPLAIDLIPDEWNINFLN